MIYDNLKGLCFCSIIWFGTGLRERKAVMERYRHGWPAYYTDLVYYCIDQYQYHSSHDHSIQYDVLISAVLFLMFG
jgi:hypothetical protein